MGKDKKEYAEKNKAWLEEKAQEPGVEALGGAVYYRVIKSGNAEGRTPDRNSVVTVHYTGKTINGKKFDSSLSGVAPAFRLKDLIEGWIIALQRMHVGDKWELYIPADKGYGKFSQYGIPGGSTLIFQIEFLGIA